LLFVVVVVVLSLLDTMEEEEEKEERRFGDEVVEFNAFPSFPNSVKWNPHNNMIALQVSDNIYILVCYCIDCCCFYCSCCS